jgi:hypothetical protein
MERSDVERIIENVLRDLKIKVEPLKYGEDANIKCITLSLGEKELSRTYIDVSS